MNDIEYDSCYATLIGHVGGWHDGCTSKSVRFHITKVVANVAEVWRDEHYVDLNEVEYIPIAAYTSLPSYCPFLTYEIQVMPQEGSSVYDVMRVMNCSKRFEDGIPRLELQRHLLRGKMSYLVLDNSLGVYRLRDVYRSVRSDTYDASSDADVVKAIYQLLVDMDRIPLSITSTNDVQRDNVDDARLVRTIKACTADYFRGDVYMFLMRYFSSSFLERFEDKELDRILDVIKRAPYTWCFRSLVCDAMGENEFDVVYHCDIKDVSKKNNNRFSCSPTYCVDDVRMKNRTRMLQLRKEPAFYHVDYPYWSLQTMRYATRDLAAKMTEDITTIGTALAAYLVCEHDMNTVGRTLFERDAIEKLMEESWYHARRVEDKRCNAVVSNDRGMYGPTDDGDWMAFLVDRGVFVKHDRGNSVDAPAATSLSSAQPRYWFEYRWACKVELESVQRLSESISSMAVLRTRHYGTEYTNVLKAIIHKFKGNDTVFTSFGHEGCRMLGQGTSVGFMPAHVVLSEPHDVVTVRGASSSQKCTIVVDRMHKMDHYTLSLITAKFAQKYGRNKVDVVGIGDERDYPGVFGKGSNLFNDLWIGKTIGKIKIEHVEVPSKGNVESYSHRMVMAVQSRTTGSMPIISISDESQFESHYRSVLKEAKKRWKKNYTIQVLATNETDRISLLTKMYKVNLSRFDRDVVRIGDVILAAEIGFIGLLRGMKRLNELGEYVQVRKKEDVNLNHAIVEMTLEDQMGSTMTFNNTTTTLIHSEVQLTSTYTGGVSDCVILYLGRKITQSPFGSISNDMTVAAKYCSYMLSVVVLSDLDMNGIYNEAEANMIGDHKSYITGFSNKLM
jgi:hypothetical protein